jgi:TPR repeat protein
LLAQGEQAEQLGNLSGARRYYASAVQLGSATAARKLGRLYDPVFLKQVALGGIDPDLGQARHWYELAADMGDPDVAPLLEALASR